MSFYEGAAVLIKVNGLTKRYGNFLAVDNISFNLRKGEILGFLGPNGAGKTTTMRIITGFLSATEGEVTVAGHDIFDNPLAAKKQIGYLPELPPLYREMRVKDYLAFCGRLKGIKSGRQLRQRLEYVMEKMSLTHMATRHVQALSKGYRQRVGLAQALIHNPPVLILDEPSSGLDPHQIIDVRELIRQLSGEHSILLSTHILPEAQLTCDRVLIIDHGKILAEDTTEDLTGKLKGAERFILSFSGNEKEIMGKISSLKGVVSTETMKRGSGNEFSCEIECEKDIDIRGTIAATVVGGGAALLELRPRAMTLEEIFIQITAQDSQAKETVAQ